jgi:hypothetical protein
VITEKPNILIVENEIRIAPALESNPVKARDKVRGTVTRGIPAI